MSDSSDSAKPAPDDKALSIQQVAKKLGMSESWVHLQVRKGTFPKPLTSGGAPRWSLRDIDQWLAERKRQRDRVNDDWSK